MRIFVCFMPFSDDGLNVLLFGKFEYVDLLFVREKQTTLFYTRPHDTYRRAPVTKDGMLPRGSWSRDAFLEVLLSEDDGQKLWNTCQTFAAVATPYNFLDFVLSIVPLRSPDERPLFENRTLSDVQAVILFLRECLSRDHKIVKALEDLNSRQASAAHLFENLLPVTQELTWTDLQKILP